MKISLKHLTLIIVLLFVSIKLHHKEINEFPKHIHAWAQSDYYAISLGFIDNQLDFFHPQNFVQNPQFPDYFKTPKDNGITAADFPIHTYIPAILMKSIGSEDPWVFRSYILFFSLVGLFALFLLIKELGGSDVKAVFGVLLLLLSPVYLYYRAGFLPSIPSLSNVIIAYYFYFKYLKSNRSSYFNWAILFFTLAALSRTPFAIFLIASFCQEGLTVIKKRKVNYKILIPYIFSFSLIIGYFIYNAYLRQKYGSIFLGKPLYPHSWNEAKELIFKSLENWKYHYLTKCHYLFIVLAIIIAAIQYIKRKEIDPLQKKLLIHLTIVLIGVVMYSMLMLQQFVAHDYYFIDTFLTPFILFTTFALTFIKFNQVYLNLIAFVILSYFIYNITLNSLDAQVQRHESGAWDNTLFTIQNYTNGKNVLDELNIPKGAKLLVLDSEAPNIPFILLRRYGYTVHSLTKNNIVDKLNWNYDYIVAQNANIQKLLFEVYPELNKTIERVGGNSTFSIYKKTEKLQEKTIDQLLQLDTKIPFYYNSIAIDSIWNNENKVTDSSIVIRPDQEYGLSLEISNTKELLNTALLVKLTINTTTKAQLINAKVILAISEGGKTVFYQDRVLLNGKHNYIFTTTPLESIKNKISLYLWNPQKETIKVEQFEIKIY
jgi:hypothetical protein